MSGLYFFVLFGLFFLFVWANLTNYKLPIAKALGGVAFAELLWIFSKLMLLSGIGWESVRVWMWVLTTISWLLPAILLHFSLSLNNRHSPAHYYLMGIGYTLPLLVSILLFLFPSLMPTRYIFIGQSIWDGVFQPSYLFLHLGFVGIYCCLSLFASRHNNRISLLVIFGAYITFYLRTVLLAFDIATYWRGWLFLQPFLALVSYLLLYLLYRRNFWLEDSFSVFALDKILHNFTLPVLILKPNQEVWYMNQAMSSLLSKNAKNLKALSEYLSCCDEVAELSETLSSLNAHRPIQQLILHFHPSSTETLTFYTHCELITITNNKIAGYVIALTPLESEHSVQLAQKHLRLRKQLEELQQIYKSFFYRIEKPLILTTTEWTVVEANPAAYKLLAIHAGAHPLSNARLPLSRVITEHPYKSEQKFLLEIDFGSREWQQLSSQRKDIVICEFTVIPINNYYLITIEDKMQSEKQDEHLHFEARFYRSLQRLTLQYLTTQNNEEWFNTILDAFMEIFAFPGYITIFSEVKDNEKVSPKAIRGIDITTIEKVNNLLGKKLSDTTFRIPPHFTMEKNIMLSGKLYKLTGGLQELFFYSINPMATMILEHIVQVGDIYIIGISHSGTLYGLLIIIIQKGYTFKELEWIETFAEELSNLFTLRTNT